MLSVLAELFERDLTKLIEEINLYDDESYLWKVEKSISNSAGNLCLHLVGNLNHFVGTHLGNTGYIRVREAEFTTKNIARVELIRMIDDTKNMVSQTLSNISDADVNKEYPILFTQKKVTINYILIWLLSHVSYHLGQVNYHRRMLTV